MNSRSEYLTVAEVAAILKVSAETVIRRFATRPGVLDLGESNAIQAPLSNSTHSA